MSDVAARAIVPEYFTLRQLAAYSGLSVDTLRRALRDLPDPLPSFRVGAKILVARVEFDAWVSRRRQPTAAEADARIDEVLADLLQPRPH